MKFDELGELKQGEEIKYIGKNTDQFTKDKYYTVVETSIGRMVRGNTRIGYFLYDNNLYEQFSKSA